MSCPAAIKDKTIVQCINRCLSAAFHASGCYSDFWLENSSKIVMGTTHCVNLDPHLILRLPQKDIMLKYAREEFQQDR